MNRFSYVQVASVDEAVAALAADAAAKVVAGGTNLIDLMKYNVERPTRLVDITRVPGLDRIEETEGGGLRVGALVPNTQGDSVLRVGIEVSAIHALGDGRWRPGMSGGDGTREADLWEVFSVVPDHRRAEGKRYPLAGLLAIIYLTH